MKICIYNVKTTLVHHEIKAVNNQNINGFLKLRLSSMISLVLTIDSVIPVVKQVTKKTTQ